MRASMPRGAATGAQRGHRSLAEAMSETNVRCSFQIEWRHGPPRSSLGNRARSRTTSELGGCDAMVPPRTTSETPACSA